MTQEIDSLKHHILGCFFYTIIWGFVPRLIDRFLYLCTSSERCWKKKARLMGRFCGNVLLFWNAHTPKGSFSWYLGASPSLKDAFR